jgi:putative phage-type endonuclease
MEQRSEKWFAARLGKVTASKVSDVVAKTKSGYGASRATYMSQLLVERLTNTRTEFYSNAAMQWGTDTEPQARAAYEFIIGNSVVEEGFIPHPTIKMSGASPDGLVNDDGMLEIKCPNTSTHVQTLLDEKIPKKYVDQMQWQMACAEREWCDFVSFDPRMPEGNDFFCVRVDRDGDKIAELEAEVMKFLGELDEMVSTLNKRIKNNV